ncbi:MAG: N5-carboxyaminoimidazole ribonucleotide synthase [uncultured Solirubrobacteraceae bacterium]|uniref:N5-carboxyaminoimidazole ribonucleotide synthase n=1 Tax=uncultured Solirubrobacteraceae bacterium TaxID=1162706 RepID=A0A6J4SZL1_9ACTN|nr:MAG: N5-carboxyaminoimidazole ribonucleotide synthase [uncultured Solirubrobacteraceae bacterium]
MTTQRGSGQPTVGIVGAGQLARMTALAAAGMDVRVAVLTEDPGAPAVAAGAFHVHGEERSLEGLRALAAVSDVITFDHEGVPPAVLREFAHDGVPMRPHPAAQLMAQDKVVQRETLGGRLGLPVPAHRVVASREDVEAFAADAGWPVVLKLSSGGYDGRGVWFIDDAAGADEALSAAQEVGTSVLAEERVELDYELAVLVARTEDGRRVVYPPVHTVQRDGMCREMAIPAAPAPAALRQDAEDLAVAIAEGIDAVGIMAVELFVHDGRLLINELALRPHNSGHWSLGGAVTSQFENHLRAVLGWPLGITRPVAPAVACANVIGPDSPDSLSTRLPDALTVAGALVQLYGKESRPGRKLGHVTAIGDDVDEARDRARRAAALLEGGSA